MFPLNFWIVAVIENNVLVDTTQIYKKKINLYSTPFCVYWRTGYHSHAALLRMINHMSKNQC